VAQAEALADDEEAAGAAAAGGADGTQVQIFPLIFTLTQTLRLVFKQSFCPLLFNFLPSVLV